MKAPQGINYRGSDWAAIKKALGEMILQLDVANRRMDMPEADTMRNRSLQSAYQTIIDWDRQPVDPQLTPIYAVPQGGYDPNVPHPDDDPI